MQIPTALGQKYQILYLYIMRHGVSQKQENSWLHHAETGKAAVFYQLLLTD